ncbi:MAG: carboxypeptidase regulatory-like domain-containing protein [Thermoanaerobaculia bacterium]|nr:carboxypeptidase regulatory-like domain-containing protein [Thermoanaerobaculia bacterium]
MQSDRFWSPEQVLVAHGGRQQVAMELYALGRAKGRVELIDRAAAPPRELVARFRRSSKPGSESVEGTVICPIEAGLWTCRLPALELDLSLRALGFVSHYFWSQKVPPADSLDLGVLKLKQGASIVGRVELPDGSPPPPACIVQITTEQAGRSSAVDGPGTGALAESVGVNERGFFHFEGVAPGSWVATARLTGFVAGSTAPILVVENREATLLEPLRLERPLELEIAVQPAVDPTGEPWKLMLRRSEPPELIFVARADGEGRLHKTGIAPGRFVLEVEDDRGSRLAAKEIELAPEHTFFTVDLPLLWIEGELRLGAEPLAGELHFGGRHSGVSIRMEAGEDGAFGGWLPRSGDWEVDVDAREPPVARRLRHVAVEKVPGLGLARVQIELPDTRLEGEVVDEEGEPVPRAAVVAMPFPPVEKPAVAFTDETGAFLFRGFAPSAFRVEARRELPGEKAVSAAVEVTVSEKSSTPVRLVLERLVELRGTLVSPTGTGSPER